MNSDVQAVYWDHGACVLLDQTKLPAQQVYLRCESADQVIDAIKNLRVRGAPAIGIAAAYGVALAAQEASQSAEPFVYFKSTVDALSKARPTAVNLRWAVSRMMAKFAGQGVSFDAPALNWLTEEARAIHAEDIEANRRIALLGALLFPKPMAILTYCNAGALATGGVGTALGVIHEAFRQKKITQVYVCETRPVLQGLRLTTWELDRYGIPYLALCDNMAASLMRAGKIGAVVVGADRVAANGDTANKVGTYMLAVLARYHRIPFFVAAPRSTFDFSVASGEQIPIEEREKEEILTALESNPPPYPLPCLNPSFDITPHELITGLITEQGVIRDPDEKLHDKIK